MVFNFIATYEDGTIQPLTIALSHESETVRDAWIKVTRFATESKKGLKSIEIKEDVVLTP